MIKPIKNFEGISCTVNTTESCNLACKYCYEINKRNKTIDPKVVHKFIDCLLDDPDPIGVTGTKDEWMLHSGLILDFIGGDALMEPKIVDDALTYLVQQMTIKNHRWKNNWRASISSNGTLFENKPVRDLIAKWGNNLSIGVSIDGCPAIHDKNRIYAEPNPDGSERGSMSKIMEWWPWVKAAMPYTGSQTKATCSKDSIPYLYESLVFMHETLGMSHINQNFIMEATGCTDEDYMLLDEQLEKCMYYLLDHRHELYWSMFDRQGVDKRSDSVQAHDHAADSGQCGSGAMPTIGMTGKIYPCFRWLPHTLANYQDQADPHCIGDVNTGFSHKERFREVKEATRKKISSDYCYECEYDMGCPYCIGGCYSEFNDFKRTEHICTISKIRNKWSAIYWREYNRLDGRQNQYFNAFVDKDGKATISFDAIPKEYSKTNMTPIVKTEDDNKSDCFSGSCNGCSGCCH